MVSANKLSVTQRIKLIFPSLMVLFVVSCAVPQKKLAPPPPEDVQFESPESLWLWYDPTQKIYYGLKGPVKTLVIKPVSVQSATSDMDVTGGEAVGWRLRFKPGGRLLWKKRTDADAPFETRYEYHPDGQSVKRIASYYDGNLWRSSDYSYQNGKLTIVEYADHIKNDRFSVQVRRQHTPRGWFEIQTPVGKISVPVYHEYQPGNKLVWASKGGINNGLGAMYYIQTADSVNSSSVTNRNTPHMSGQGGYRYHYYANGLLQSVESYNAHDNSLFHATTYQYNNLQLLKSERKVVTGDSVFNEVANASVEYHYQSVDRYGNWLQRSLQYHSGNRRASVVETRSIEYFDNGKAGAVFEKTGTKNSN